MTLAAELGDTTSLCALLQYGADINKRDMNRLTPLLAAVHFGMAGAAQTLIESGARTDPVDGSRHTALEIATALGNVDMVRCLLEARDPNDGEAELQRACGDANLRGHYEVASLIEAELLHSPPQSQNSSQSSMDESAGFLASSQTW